ncbi:hypothetical protein BMW22_28280 (plasmid) [Rhizobium leguminosarum]|uniref:DUF4261 domain-containing protein n=1 Tax=Rhizobium leguminosarum TaxID=384 RepID=A0A1L3ZIB8_RHILE|nr:DUF4261 domain-containing protein [Rhizobium leguminosarum]API55404.1 hypothetical protein BMW22_28280 [Rhizobium leguminosarum]
MSTGDQNETEGTAMTALILLMESVLSGGGSLLHLLHNAFPRARVSAAATSSASAPPFIFNVDGLLCTVMHIPAPAPIRELDPEIRNARFWPNAWSTISRHQSHLVVTVAGGSDGIARAMVLQRILVAVFVTQGSAIGSVYPSSGTLLPRKVVESLLHQDGQLAVPLFVSCFFAKEADEAFPAPSILASTKGLSDFGVMEVEARGFQGSVSELHQFILGISGHLIQSRPDIRDGHTIGVSEAQRIPVKIERSLFYSSQVYSPRFQ